MANFLQEGLISLNDAKVEVFDIRHAVFHKLGRFEHISCDFAVDFAPLVDLFGV